jgi:hypothetical protein
MFFFLLLCRVLCRAQICGSAGANELSHKRRGPVRFDSRLDPFTDILPDGAGWSVFDSAHSRKHIAAWFFHQEKAAFDAVARSICESKTL